ncbi:MAG: N-formylglutamate amidohydrolase [Azospirillaceae bacterium]
MTRLIENVLLHEPPAALPVPVVFDSPHSGTVYPDDFGFACPLAKLRQAEDTFVDDLYRSAPAHGAHLLLALFPRAYIDVNRQLEDMDQALLDEPWPGPVDASEKTAIGKGLIWRLLLGREPIYDRRLTVAEVTNRIDSFYRPYHATLDGLIEGTAERYGMVYHVNCHSMPAVVTTLDRPEGIAVADFVLGDRDGTTCEPDFTELVRETLAGFGYAVKLNDPFKGVELVRRHGRPAENRHSLQIEINRRVYMDEASFEKSDHYPVLAGHIDRLIKTITGFARLRAA